MSVPLRDDAGSERKELLYRSRPSTTPISVEIQARKSSRPRTEIVIDENVRRKQSSVRRRDGQSMRSKLPAPLPYSRPNLVRAKSFNSEWLDRRKSLFNQRRRLADAAFIFAVIGICIMVFESEMSAAHVYEKCSTFSNAAKSIISCSTFVLLLLIVWYYILDAKMYMIDNVTSDWLAIATPGRIFCLLLELSICSVHPFPGCYPFAWGDRLTSPSAGVVTVDVPLSILMFLRFYLVGRLIMLHSTLFNSTSSRSIGALNQVNFSMSFAFRSLMTVRPGKALVIFTLSYWIIASWCIRACDRFEDEAHAVWWNAMWIIAITFTTVGYGDMYGVTYCGRSVSVVTGVVGVATTAFLVTVLTQHLSLSMAEKNVQNFVIAHHLNNRMRTAAANIIREYWLWYKHSKLSIHTSRARTHRRRLMRAIHDMHQVRVEQRKLYDDADNLAIEHEEPPNKAITTSAADQASNTLAIERKVDRLSERIDQLNTLLLQFHDNMHVLMSSVNSGQQLSPLSVSAIGSLPVMQRTVPQNTYREYHAMTPPEESRMEQHLPTANEETKLLD